MIVVLSREVKLLSRKNCCILIRLYENTITYKHFWDNTKRWETPALVAIFTWPGHGILSENHYAEPPAMTCKRPIQDCNRCMFSCKGLSLWGLLVMCSRINVDISLASATDAPNFCPIDLKLSMVPTNPEKAMTTDSINSSVDEDFSMVD